MSIDHSRYTHTAFSDTCGSVSPEVFFAFLSFFFLLKMFRNPEELL